MYNFVAAKIFFPNGPKFGSKILGGPKYCQKNLVGQQIA